MTQPDKLLSIEEVEAYTNYLGGEHFDKFLPVRIAKQLADTMRQLEEIQLCHKEMVDAIMRENEMLREALGNARHIMRVENLLESWSENVKKIDAALASCKHPDDGLKNIGSYLQPVILDEPTQNPSTQKAYDTILRELPTKPDL